MVSITNPNTTVLGTGTQGLGDRGARAATTDLYKTHMKDYWDKKAELEEERRRHQAAHEARIAREAAMSPMARHKLKVQQREKETQEMTRERKKLEAEQRKQMEAEVRQKNKRIRAQKEQFLQEAAAAREARMARAKKELKVLREKRQEMLEANRAELSAQEEELEAKIQQMRQWHEESRERARMEEEERKRAIHEEAVAARKAQREKERLVAGLRVDIEEQKRGSIQTFRAVESVMQNRRAHRNDYKTGDVEAMRQLEKKAVEERRKARAKQVAQLRDAVARRREEEHQAMKALREEQEQRVRALQRAGREGRMMHKEVVVANQEEQHRYNAEYVRELKELWTTRSPSPAESPSRSH